MEVNLQSSKSLSLVYVPALLLAIAFSLADLYLYVIKSGLMEPNYQLYLPLYFIYILGNQIHKVINQIESRIEK